MGGYHIPSTVVSGDMSLVYPVYKTRLTSNYIILSSGDYTLNNFEFIEAPTGYLITTDGYLTVSNSDIFARCGISLNSSGTLSLEDVNAIGDSSGIFIAYESGNVPTIRNVKISKYNIAIYGYGDIGYGHEVIIHDCNYGIYISEP